MAAWGLPTGPDMVGKRAAHEDSPDERLAERIVRRLVAEGMVAAADAGALRGAVAAGQVNKAAWRELAEGDAGVRGGEALSFDAVLGGEERA